MLENNAGVKERIIKIHETNADEWWRLYEDRVSKCLRFASFSYHQLLFQVNIGGTYLPSRKALRGPWPLGDKYDCGLPSPSAAMSPWWE